MVKTRQLKSKRVLAGITHREMADALGISLSSYMKKERGDIRFSDREKAVVAEMLNLNLIEVNEILYDSMLPI